MTPTKALSSPSLRFGHLVIGAWSLFVIWCLEFGALVKPLYRQPNLSFTLAEHLLEFSPA
jgi:hypothetical protein